MTPAYIALGSNLCRPQSQLNKAVAALKLLPDTALARVSSVYRSAAVGPGPQPDYLNAVVLLATTLSPLALLHAMQQIEQEQGRVRDVRWGPRTLDLDLLLYGDLKITSLKLTVPHPRMQQRNFVLHPLREISDTNLVLPDGSDLDTLLQQCPGDGLVKTRYQLRINQHRKSG
jgi:2-amino-4-hydroxy-6-hydroxymethyldihydropteridine diphosphokinase